MPKPRGCANLSFNRDRGAMKDLLFGSLSFSRGDVPDSLRQLESWPTVDHMAMSEEVREDFKSRCEAIRLFLDETTMPVSSITAVTGIQRGTLYRLLKRCWTKHTDGQIYGFRGAIPYARFKPYTRTAPVRAARAGPGGAAGAFEQLLSQHPKIKQLLMKHAKKRDKKIQGPAVFKKSMLGIHQQFLRLCREEGIDPTHYPFSESRMAFPCSFLHMRWKSHWRKTASMIAAPSNFQPRCGKLPSRIAPTL
ncbi:MAG: hypothetical protein JWR40_1025 [Massilia sp.]|nr:hypothetical protein [Massilia sp.]MDB5950737.1 hypothetical protein [Massilia sp.]